MSIILETILNWPPSTNHYLGSKGKKQYLTKRVKDYRKSVNDIINVIYKFLPPKDTNKVKLTIAYMPPSKRRYDSSNFVKQLEDALMHSNLIKDDSQIYQHQIYKFDKQDNIAGAYVLIEHLTDDDIYKSECLLEKVKQLNFKNI